MSKQHVSFSVIYEVVVNNYCFSFISAENCMLAIKSIKAGIALNKFFGQYFFFSPPPVTLSLAEVKSVINTEMSGFGEMAVYSSDTTKYPHHKSDTV